MAQVSTRTIAEALYEATLGKEGKDLAIVLENATAVLASKHLLSRAPEILAHLQEIIDQKEGTVRAHVESAHKLTRGIHEDIETELKKRYKAKHIELEHTINEQHLGGIKIQVGDEIIDLTLSNYLQQLQNHLIAN